MNSDVESWLNHITMAKWGEGDPRWIVEERPDAVNVNNWHWTEKNACSWSEAKFKELFQDFKIIEDKFKSRITKVDKTEGEATASNRKGKLIFFYEWELTLDWKGKINGADEFVTGKIVIPNLSEENNVEEIEVNVTVNESTADAQTMRELMHAHCKEKIKGQLAKYIQGLKDEFSQGMILPSKDGAISTKSTINNLSSGLESKCMMNSNNDKVVKNANNVGTKLDTSSLKINQKFQCTSSELYNALTVPELVMAFTQGPVKLDLRPGGAFEMFGGNIVGEFIELVPNQKIVQKWRVKRWPDGIYSTVTIELTQESDHTQLNLKQTGVPSSELEGTKENWTRYYWESLKRSFGFGAFL